jgi:hypothetical protein
MKDHRAGPVHLPWPAVLTLAKEETYGEQVEDQGEWSRAQRDREP